MRAPFPPVTSPWAGRVLTLRSPPLAPAAPRCCASSSTPTARRRRTWTRWSASGSRGSARETWQAPGKCSSQRMRWSPQVRLRSPWCPPPPCVAAAAATRTGDSRRRSGAQTPTWPSPWAHASTRRGTGRRRCACTATPSAFSASYPPSLPTWAASTWTWARPAAPCRPFSGRWRKIPGTQVPRSTLGSPSLPRARLGRRRRQLKGPFPRL